MIYRIAADRFFRLLDGMPHGKFEVHCPDGRIRELGQGSSGDVAKLAIHNWKMFPSVMCRGEIGLTETYRDGYWSTPDLSNVLTTGMENTQSITSLIRGSFVTRALSQVKYLARANSLKGSRKNIQAHYDLGNDFYELWLDQGMTYSSALYQGQEQTNQQEVALNIAQQQKYDRIINQLDADTGSLLEIGCGWGAFAERALERGDFDYKGVTLSDEQKAYADNRLGRDDLVKLQDYRHLDGKFQSIVSIEMFEAVGEAYWPVYFAKLKSLLAEEGTAVLQTITIKNESFEKYRTRGDMFRTFIFPGGMLPSPARFAEEAEKVGLQITDQFEFGLDYARTLKVWLADFEANLDEIRSQGFDEGFIRVWRFYLAACIAGFTTGNTNVMQVKLTHA